MPSVAQEVWTASPFSLYGSISSVSVYSDLEGDSKGAGLRLQE